MSTANPKFDLGDIVNVSRPMLRGTMRFVASDIMPNGKDVYFSDETGQRLTSMPLGIYELIDHDKKVSKRLREIDREIEKLVAERDQIIEERINEESIFD